AEESSRASWLALGKEPPPEYAERKARYADEQTEIEKKAREKEKERDAKIAESNHLLHRHHRYANAVAIFQVGIALRAGAALTRSRGVWFLSMLLGAAGVGFFCLPLGGWSRRKTEDRASEAPGPRAVLSPPPPGRW